LDAGAVLLGDARRLPGFLASLVAKGRYRAEEQTWRCYHCEPGLTRKVPWDERELAARSLEAGVMQIRADIKRPDTHAVTRH